MDIVLEGKCLGQILPHEVFQGWVIYADPLKAIHLVKEERLILYIYIYSCIEHARLNIYIYF